MTDERDDTAPRPRGRLASWALAYAITGMVLYLLARHTLDYDPARAARYAVLLVFGLVAGRLIGLGRQRWARRR